MQGVGYKSELKAGKTKGMVKQLRNGNSRKPPPPHHMVGLPSTIFSIFFPFLLSVSFGPFVLLFLCYVALIEYFEYCILILVWAF